MTRTALALLALVALSPSFAQERLRSSPLFAEYERFQADVNRGLRLPNPQAEWLDDHRLVYRDGDSWVTLDAKTGAETRSAERPQVSRPPQPEDPNARRRNPGRARQFAEAFNADGTVRAFHRDGEVWVEVDGGEAKRITHDSTADGKVRSGTGTWVYGEELGQRDGLGVTRAGDRVWYYRMDERETPVNVVVGGQRTLRPTFTPQAYPKPGDPNPVADLYVADVATGASRRVETRVGDDPFGVGHYVYDIEWAPDGSELIFRRTDRRQRTMEVCAADPATGRVRVVVREVSPGTHTPNKLGLTLLDDHPEVGAAPRFRGKALYESDRNGFVNLFLLDHRSGGLTPLTTNLFDLHRVDRIDLVAGRVWYSAGSEPNPYLRQLWTVGLDGRGNRRVTDPRWHHSVTVAPGGGYVLDTAQSVDELPQVRVIRADGTLVKTLATGDATGWEEAGIGRVQRFTSLAADGVTTLYGRLHTPRGFDPSRRYPLVATVYGGPLDPRSGDHSETFGRPHRLCGLGFLVVELSNRGTGGRGKAFRDATYGRLGVVDVDDMAAGVRALVGRGFVDEGRIGIEGTSYGGYASLMAILRYPELFRAASVASCVSDWRHYDTIYTERFMGLPEENEEGYAAGSAMTYLDRLQGRVFFTFGTADDNTLPVNTLQVMAGLARQGRAFDLAVGVDAGHIGPDFLRMAEFFLERMGIHRFDE